MPTTSYRRLQQYALAISVASILYNGAEGGVSIGLGADADSRSLIFFGIQSAIEVISSILVVWRFRNVAKPGEERGRKLNDRELRIEKIASTSIAILLILLGIAAEVTSILSLAQHTEPNTSTVSLVISASALGIMIVIWLPKRWLARTLNSSAMQAEAQCSLSCIQITIVLFVGALIFKLWKGGWWVDSATSIVLGLAFAWEGIKLLRWVRNPAFDGGCCGHDHAHADKEMGLEEQYRDLCECCSEKEECKNSDECKCSHSEGSDIETQVSKACCVPVNTEGSKCCTHEYVPKPTQLERFDSCCGGNAPVKTKPAKPAQLKRPDSCCGGTAAVEVKPPKPAQMERADSCCGGPTCTEDKPAEPAQVERADSCCGGSGGVEVTAPKSTPAPVTSNDDADKKSNCSCCD